MSRHLWVLVIFTLLVQSGFLIHSFWVVYWLMPYGPYDARYFNAQVTFVLFPLMMISTIFTLMAFFYERSHPGQTFIARTSYPDNRQKVAFQEYIRVFFYPLIVIIGLITLGLPLTFILYQIWWNTTKSRDILIKKDIIESNSDDNHTIKKVSLYRTLSLVNWLFFIKSLIQSYCCEIAHYRIRAMLFVNFFFGSIILYDKKILSQFLGRPKNLYIDT